ncbi:hypothetical protein CDAR_203691 [Caerostris darwini]|uniref:Uncharacterized protein n=1 Tax=Caerostris darwini TaxID=1538125 RepID=A0AAV4RWC3_9ARAC|nr:hypothetical protein CDAR_203691 [Caerostris darwini]
MKIMTTPDECRDQRFASGNTDTEIKLARLDPEFITHNVLRLRDKSKYFVAICQIITYSKLQNYRTLDLVINLTKPTDISKRNWEPFSKNRHSICIIASFTRGHVSPAAVESIPVFRCQMLTGNLLKKAVITYASLQGSLENKLFPSSNDGPQNSSQSQNSTQENYFYIHLYTRNW